MVWNRGDQKTSVSFHNEFLNLEKKQKDQAFTKKSAFSETIMKICLLLASWDVGSSGPDSALPYRKLKLLSQGPQHSFPKSQGNALITRI